MITPENSKIKKRILIPIDSNNGVRNFVDSGAFSALEKDYELHFVVLSYVKKSLPTNNCFRIGPEEVIKRSRVRTQSFFLSMKRYQDRSSTFPVKYHETFYKYLPLQKKLITNILTLPGIAELFLKFNELRLGTMADMDRIIESVKPALVIVPCSFNETFTLDCLKSAKQKGIKNLFLMFNWDNVSSKGVLPLLPDYMTVWGPQTQEHACKIHRMPKERTFILGAPQFENYRRGFKYTREEFRRLNGLLPDERVILFAGISRLIDEAAILAQLEEAIERGELNNVRILYRPHPWRTVSKTEKNFFDCGFKHITMDWQMRDHYRRIMSADKLSDEEQGAFVPDYDYYSSLFNAVDAVISPGTTMGIEAMIMGKPVLIKAFADEAFHFGADKMIHTYEHHSCWKRMQTPILCVDRKNFISDCNRMLKILSEPGSEERIKQEVQYVVFQDERPYAERLKACVENIMQPNGAP